MTHRPLSSDRDLSCDEEARFWTQSDGEAILMPSGLRRARAIFTRRRLLVAVPSAVGAFLVASCSLKQLGPRARGIDAPVATAALERAFEQDMQDIDACGNSIRLNDFSSKGSMQTAGWAFSWDDEFAFRPLMYRDFAPPESYWGFALQGEGSITLTVKGEGMLTLDFGNLLGAPDSQVSVFLNGNKLTKAEPSQLSKTVQTPYKNLDKIVIAQDPTGIVLINSIELACTTTTTQSPVTTTKGSEEDEKIKDAEERFKLEHEKLHKAAEHAEKKAQEHYAAVKLEQAAETALASPKAKPKQPAKAEAQGAEKDAQAQEVAEALMDMLMNAGKAAEAKAAKAAATGPPPEEDNVDANATEQETNSTNPETEKEKAKERAELQRQVESARKQAAEAMKELRKAREDEELQVNKSAEAAKEMKEAIQFKKEKEEEEERNRKVAEQAKSSTSEETTTTTTVPSLANEHSLYCFTLMLPFGYEPALLAEQAEKKVGFYRCEEFDAFSNTTVYLDREDHPKLPVDVELLDYSLAVEYGGKWHTALNTPVFNKLWQKVRDLGRYLKHDWVVKADIDTVWFPERLRIAISKGIPAEALETHYAAARQRRLAANDCKNCKLPDNNDMCEYHVRALQKDHNMTCMEALRMAARPPPVDCGCVCAKEEACELSADPDKWLDGHYTRGDLLSDPPAVYINNCRFGLHGPIEVLSSGAVTAYNDGLPQCEFLLAQPWGEDKFVDRCMMALGVARVNIFHLLSEVACGEEPAPCGSTTVAFHPFKKSEDFFACWDFAMEFGHGPFEIQANRSRGHGGLFV